MKTTLRYLTLNAQATWHRQMEEQLQHLPSNRIKRNDSMQPNAELAGKDSEGVVTRGREPTQRIGESGAPAKASIPKRFRRLKWNELVSPGDFIRDSRRGFEPWEGPSGFRADAFVKPIYRQDQIRSTATKKCK